MKRSASPVSVRVGLDGPADCRRSTSSRDVDPVAVADVAGEVVLVDHLAHVAAGSPSAVAIGAPVQGLKR